ncbi:MAG: ATP-binding protein [Verrucomicrobiota bacterium]|jgi:signal transduction histidine kinase
MNRALKIRLAAFGLSIGVLAALIGWAAFDSWREVSRLRASLSTGHLRSFEIADHVQDETLRLYSRLVRYDLQPDAKELQNYRLESAELNNWIDAQKPVLRPAELEVLNQIDRAYDIFLVAATNGLDQAAQSEEAKLRHIEGIQKAAQPLLELGYRLEDAHRQLLEDSLLASQKSVSVLRWLIFGSILLLLGSLAWLSMTVYREMIMPLRLQLVQSKEIIERQEKLASLGVLAAGVAHEIRNPLTALKARLFSHQRSFDRNSPEYRDALVIGNELNRLERIVQDFLQFARPSEPRLATLTPEKTLAEVRDLLAPQCEKLAIQLKLDIQSTGHFRADPQQLKQVLINLVQNAAESIGRNGQITLRAREGAARLGGQHRRAIFLETEDNGKGIPADVQKRLFDPFFSTKESGTGLGLSIAARIVEKHGGLLEFQTSPHRGTTFGVILPTCSPHDNGA